MEDPPVKLLYAIAFAFFPLAATAQTVDSSLLTALCHDDYFEDTAGQCRSVPTGEVLTIEAILEKYGAIVTRETDDESAIVYLTDPENLPSGTIRPRSESPAAEHAILTDENDCADSPIEQEMIASRIVLPESQLAKSAEADDDVTTTGPTTRHIPAVEAGPGLSATIRRWK
jgi:hypothetical protein